MSVFVDIIPEVNHDMFCARVVMSDYSPKSPLSITVEARRDDGTAETKSLVYPEDGIDYQENIVLYFFGMHPNSVAQIIGVRVNGEYIYTEYKTVKDSDYQIRYNDSLTRLRDYIDKNKIKLSFQVEDTHNPKNLRVVDESVWGLIEDRPAIIEILVPGFQSPSVHYFAKRQVNIFTSMTLGINCESDSAKFLDLPDGIYDITIKGSPSDYNASRKYLKTDSIRLKLDKMLVRASYLCDDRDNELISKIQDIEFCLSAAEANTRLGNICEAHELMEYANELLDMANDCVSCGSSIKKSKK